MSADSEMNILYHLQLVTEACDSATTWQKTIALRKQNQLFLTVKHNSYFCGMNPATYTFHLSKNHQQAV